MIKVKPPPFFDYEDTHSDSHHQSGECFDTSIIRQAMKSSLLREKREREGGGCGNFERNGEENPIIAGGKREDVIEGAQFTPVALSLIHFVCVCVFG